MKRKVILGTPAWPQLNGYLTLRLLRHAYASGRINADDLNGGIVGYPFARFAYNRQKQVSCSSKCLVEILYRNPTKNREVLSQKPGKKYK